MSCFYYFSNELFCERQNCRWRHQSINQYKICQRKYSLLRCFPVFKIHVRLARHLRRCLQANWKVHLGAVEMHSLHKDGHFEFRWTFPVKLPEPASWLCFRSKSLSNFPIANFHRDIRRNFLVVSSSNLQWPGHVVEANKLRRTVINF